MITHRGIPAQMYAQMGRERTYSDAQAGLWLLQAAEGLTYLHSSIPRVMHRDLKLDNILLRSAARISGYNASNSSLPLLLNEFKTLILSKEEASL